MAADVATNDATNYSTDLTIPMAAGETAVIELVIGFTTASSSQRPQMALDLPGGSPTGRWMMMAGASNGNGGTFLSGALTDTIDLLDVNNGIEWPIMGWIIITADEAGDLVLKHRRAGTSQTPGIALKAGSSAIKHASPTVSILGGVSDLTNSSNSTFEDIFDVALAEGTHWIDVPISWSTAATTTGITLVAVGTNATVAMACVASGGNVALQASSSTTFLGGGAQSATVPNGLVCRMLVTVASGGGSVAVRFRSEVNGSQVTVHRGTAFWQRPDLTVQTRAGGAAENSSDTVPTTVFTFAAEAGKSYVVGLGLNLFTSVGTTGIGIGIGVVPSDDGDVVFASAHPPTTTTSVRARLFRNTTLDVPTGGPTTPGVGIPMNGVIVADGAVSPTVVIRREAVGAGTVSAGTSSFAGMQEVELTA
jgi:hypothetical protein